MVKESNHVRRDGRAPAGRLRVGEQSAAADEREFELRYFFVHVPIERFVQRPRLPHHLHGRVQRHLQSLGDGVVRHVVDRERHCQRRVLDQSRGLRREDLEDERMDQCPDELTQVNAGAPSWVLLHQPLPRNLDASEANRRVAAGHVRHAVRVAVNSYEIHQLRFDSEHSHLVNVQPDRHAPPRPSARIKDVRVPPLQRRPARPEWRVALELVFEGGGPRARDGFLAVAAQEARNRAQRPEAKRAAALCSQAALDAPSLASSRLAALLLADSPLALAGGFRRSLLGQVLARLPKERGPSSIFRRRWRTGFRLGKSALGEVVDAKAAQRIDDDVDVLVRQVERDPEVQGVLLVPLRVEVQAVDDDGVDVDCRGAPAERGVEGVEVEGECDLIDVEDIR
mmetsp:Transcript_15286/g.51405  ORF Transcript_15286/g.51405 Transcript_15286/m.51405 type:complete len:397 (-) Transcript_15286:444-1634(-)